MDIRNILKLAAEKVASDLHIIFDHEPILRIDGELKSINSVVGENIFPKISQDDLKFFTETLLTNDLKRIFFDKRDLDFSYQVENFRYRLNFSFDKNNIKIVARIISDKEQTLEELGLPPITTKLLESNQGLILVTGPTGCGKSTTLAAMINYINNHQNANIITLEDPIEYVFNSKKSIISQRQLGSDMISFASGLKHILRQDPNVIMLGEMRDLETISTALTIAETGHLVLATLHTYSAAQTIDRIIDIFPPYQQRQVQSQLSLVLSAVISQRLLLKKKGGRVAAREILINNSAVSNMIREGKVAQLKSAIETGSSVGMVTLDRSVTKLYQQGAISRDVALKNLEDPRLIEE